MSSLGAWGTLVGDPGNPWKPQSAAAVPFSKNISHLRASRCHIRRIRLEGVARVEGAWASDGEAGLLGLALTLSEQTAIHFKQRRVRK